MVADGFLWGAVALLGLVVGSFLNVVIHRLPRMLEAQWAAASADAESAAKAPAGRPYNIAVPGSHCPQCGHVLRWMEKK
jgi:leader peptidase (prepilin peptidase)/N-methyltransferase